MQLIMCVMCLRVCKSYRERAFSDLDVSLIKNLGNL
jgi:hypothetical protein